MSSALRRLGRHPTGVCGGALVLTIVAAAALAPALDGHDPDRKNLAAGTTELGEPLPPSVRFPLGTDGFGRCVAARLFAGARLSLGVGLGAAALALVIGTAVGLAAGFWGGWVDTVLMRLCDLFLALPFVLVVVALAAALRSAGVGASGSTTAALLVLGLFAWTGTARVIRARTVAVRELDYVQAARALGAGPLRIASRHVLPNVAGTAIVLAALSTATLILAEAALSYLGLGAPPPAASWGRMLREGQPYLAGAPWLVTAPGVALLLTVLGFHLLGAGLRDALAPDARGRP
jgi:peptide/nickel transport system permease protein